MFVLYLVLKLPCCTHPSPVKDRWRMVRDILLNWHLFSSLLLLSLGVLAREDRAQK